LRINSRFTRKRPNTTIKKAAHSIAPTGFFPGSWFGPDLFDLLPEALDFVPLCAATIFIIEKMTAGVNAGPGAAQGGGI
jgi:hypothetical protein